LLAGVESNSSANDETYSLVTPAGGVALI